jgi:hypothetical protein
MTMTMSVPSTEMQQCIDNCLSCHATCEATFRYALSTDHLETDRTQMLRLLDCAEICRTSADFLLRNSGQHHATCTACAAICAECAEWCARLQRDAILKQCGLVCEACAVSCEGMAKH